MSMVTAPPTSPLTWTELGDLVNSQSAIFPMDLVNGPTNAQTKLRLFGQDESSIRVTLYRDHHAWCPYCQKIWLWLEEKQIPYRIEKVTMFCYGEKERWYKKKVPSGMLPAVELDGRLITESDDILIALEKVFGPLNAGMTDPQVMPLRRLERMLFRAWCNWLCYPTSSPRQEATHHQEFIAAVNQVESALAATSGAYFLSEFSTVDVIFTPYVERMNASLYYYKGYSLREENPRFAAWFDAMETRSTYRGTQSDFHTHTHDLPPQMGGCWSNGEPQALANQHRVDHGPWFGLPDVAYPEPETARYEALYRVVKHHQNLIRVNPIPDHLFDEALRCALTYMITSEECTPPQDSEIGLRYLRDRISVPRDMSIYAAKHLRHALEHTAAKLSDRQGDPIPVRHRRDQDPANFLNP
ncbi:MAG: glutathione S-transferase family protein [Pseudanabaenaceae cyanobacterium]